MTKTCAAVDFFVDRGRQTRTEPLSLSAMPPLALFRVLEVCEETGARPAAVVGIPVGFVGAAESKQALVDSKLA